MVYMSDEEDMYPFCGVNYCNICKMQFGVVLRSGSLLSGNLAEKLEVLMLLQQLHVA